MNEYLDIGAERPTQPSEDDSTAEYQRHLSELIEEACESSWWMARTRHPAAPEWFQSELTRADLATCAALVMADEVGAARVILLRHLERIADARTKENNDG